ncbi:metal-dependent hydrolase [Sulfitobacter sp. SK012]|uniref:metal-dependent hydrolase n=1 Tax=Sulfitobacter sp. SK012 TaxID=1389005 RepID=UPI000E0A67C7|nr:metal-dependent hydrolase [Sulfitobacter sp. SK012]AXI47505.1 metal-dependent hydrolase [Sulfitobacter sp. SK012]
MKIIWLGHGSFRIEIEDQVLLVDPWLEGNPMLPKDQHAAATAGATKLLITHGHDDHTGDLAAIANAQGIGAVGPYELMTHFGETHGVDVTAYNFGGTAKLGGVEVSLVPATHSSSLSDERKSYMGREAGFVIRGEGHCIYVSGDTGIMADMDWIGDYFKPDIGILSAGGFYTMDMAQAAYAAKRYFDFRTVIPCHYRTFGALEQSAQVLIDGLPGVDVIEPQVMRSIVF